MRYLIIIFYLLGVMNLSAQQQVLKFKVFAGDYPRKDCPVSLDLSATDLELHNMSFRLYQLKGKTEVPVTSQLEAGKNPRLWFILTGEVKRGESREYVLRTTAETVSEPRIRIEKDQQGLKFVSKGKPVLNYQFNEVYPPVGVDPLFKRSGFIHPLWSPGGEVLTRIQAPDHYHHYGLWGPWTKTHINGREVDFWNLAKGEGTVRFAGFLAQVEGPVFTGFSALQEHVDFGAKGPDQTAIHEILDVCAWNLDPESKVWLIDYTSIMNCPLDSGIMLDAYRYGGGVGFRATEKWNKDNSTVLTSEGNNRAKADGTNARWCKVEGESNSGRSGILFMSHPSNRAYPEPMRVWPENSNGRGDLYFEFCPTRHQDWKLEKGKNYSQRYRLLVFDGELTKTEAEQYWRDFANPPVFEIVK
ncbi:MAG: PmoA family protein [Mangrovibacterium sp.]